VSWTVWLTGPPASGKSAIARELVERLRNEGVAVVWLESDAMRGILAPGAGYAPEERDAFYAALADLAGHLAGQGLNVLVDATAPRRAHRQRLRGLSPDMLEVLVDAPLAVREARDPKGLYRRAREGRAPHLPGATGAYEPPAHPDLVLSGTAPAAESAGKLLELLRPNGAFRLRRREF
jgi:adenylylsulfate kinase-like enzyme